MTDGFGKRALVTGIHGFTGKYVASELSEAGYEVFGIGIHDIVDTRYRKVDLCDRIETKQAITEINPNVVTHLAGVAFVEHSDKNEVYNVNLLGTRNLLEALARIKHAPDCIILASSANVYGNSHAGMLSESEIPRPANDYAVSKLSMEYMAKLWMTQLPIVITRPFNYTGVGQSEKFLLPKIVSHFKHGSINIELGNLDVWRDFSDVRAVAHAYRRLLEVCPAGEIVNICSGVTHSLREVLGFAETITDHQIEVTVNPNYVRENEVRSLCGDPTRLKDLISSWETPPLQETLQWMLRSDV